MQVAAIVLGLAALGGLALATIRIMGTPRPPTWMALGHGVIALTGLGLLIKEANNAGIPQMAQASLALIILAALGGSALFFGFHMRQRALPILLVIGHGLIAATGYALLLVAMFRE